MTEIRVEIGQDNDRLPAGAKPLHAPVRDFQKIYVAFPLELYKWCEVTTASPRG